MNGHQDRLLALAKVWAARKDNKVSPAISPHLCKLYEYTRDQVAEVLKDLMKSAIKIPLLGRKNSFENIRETMRSNRYREVEIVVQGIL